MLTGEGIARVRENHHSYSGRSPIDVQVAYPVWKEFLGLLLKPLCNCLLHIISHELAAHRLSVMFQKCESCMVASPGCDALWLSTSHQSTEFSWSWNSVAHLGMGSRMMMSVSLTKQFVLFLVSAFEDFDSNGLQWWCQLDWVQKQGSPMPNRSSLYWWMIVTWISVVGEKWIISPLLVWEFSHGYSSVTHLITCHILHIPLHVCITFHIILPHVCQRYWYTLLLKVCLSIDDVPTLWYPR